MHAIAPRRLVPCCTLTLAFCSCCNFCACRDCPGLGTYDKVVSGNAAAVSSADSAKECQESVCALACGRGLHVASLPLRCHPTIGHAPHGTGVLLLMMSAQVSIEMIEAVGHEHLPSYFATINAALRPGGKAVIQVTLACSGEQGHQPTELNMSAWHDAAFVMT